MHHLISGKGGEDFQKIEMGNRDKIVLTLSCRYGMEIAHVLVIRAILSGCTLRRRHGSFQFLYRRLCFLVNNRVQVHKCLLLKIVFIP